MPRAGREEVWGSLDELWDDEPPSLRGAGGTGDLGTTMSLAPIRLLPRETKLRVCSLGFSLACSVPESGLSVGRDPDNDVTLGAAAVSRHHLRIFPCDEGAMVQDLGATNPALLNGAELVGSAVLHPGDVLEVRGAGTTICLLEQDES